MVKDNSKLLAALARSDINIFDAHIEGDVMVVEYEYGWHPDTYKVKWTKAIYIVEYPVSLQEALEHILREVKDIRSELE